jgi:hypothetical protein
MALAEGALGQWVDAEGHLSQALAMQNDRWILDNHIALEANLESQREHVGLVDVRSPTPGARVSIRGAPEQLLPLPQPARVPSGQITIEVTAAGHRAQRRVITARPLAAGASVETFTLERLRADELPGASGPNQTLRYVGYTLLGFGAVFAGLSAWQYANAAGIASSSRAAGPNAEEPYRSWFFYSNQTNPDRSLSASQVCSNAQTGIVNSYAAEARTYCGNLNNANALAVGFLVPAASLLVAGAVMIAIPTPSRGAPRVAAVPWMAPSSSGLSLVGSF